MWDTLKTRERRDKMLKSSDFDMETLEKEVFKLNGADVLYVLKMTGKLKDMTKEEVIQVIDEMEDTITIEWVEYMIEAIRVINAVNEDWINNERFK